MKGPEIMEITQGALYDVKMPDGGRFIATADRFEQDGHVLVLVPTIPAVRAVFPTGYKLGKALWDDFLAPLANTERSSHGGRVRAGMARAKAQRAEAQRVEARCPYPDCRYEGTDHQVDEHRLAAHSSDPQYGNNIRVGG